MEETKRTQSAISKTVALLGFVWDLVSSLLLALYAYDLYQAGVDVALTVVVVLIAIALLVTSFICLLASKEGKKEAKKVKKAFKTITKIIKLAIAVLSLLALFKVIDIPTPHATAFTVINVIWLSQTLLISLLLFILKSVAKGIGRGVKKAITKQK